MKTDKQKSHDEFLLSFSDLSLICRKGKNKIIFGMLACTFLACLYALSKPIEYHVQATFKEKNKSQSGLNKSLSAMFFSGIGDTDSDAMTLMKSRKLMEHLVKKKNLQGVISKKEIQFPLLPLKTIKKNLIVEYAYFKKKKSPALSDFNYPLEVREIVFSHEVPLNLEIIFRSNEDYIVLENKNLVGGGKLGQPFNTENYQFTLLSNQQDLLQDSQKYILTLLPLAPTAENFSKQFTLEPDRFDKALIKLNFKHSDRYKAAELLNEFMAVYQDYLQTEHQRLASIQLNYLEKRQEEMRDQLLDIMTSYAKTLSTDLTNTGFADTKNAMEFLTTSQANYKQKLMGVELEINRLENAKNEGTNSFDKFISNEESSLTSEIRSLKQQADSLDLALRYSTPLDPETLQETFFAQLAQLDEIKECSRDAKLILANLEQNDLNTPNLKLVDNSKFMVKTWYERLNDTYQAFEQASESESPFKKNEWNNCKTSFIAYLTNLLHLFEVHQRTIEERIAHQQTPQEEFQGISLNVARELYLSYSRQINDLQAQVIQDQFILLQIDDPEFEVTSLSAVLKDSVSTEMISRASALILSIKDRDNRSQKEVERLKAELAIQKGFLTTHLVQHIQLLNLHIQHLKEKIQQSQSTLLTLIQEQITILQNHMSEYITDRLSSLKLEKNLIKKSIEEIRADMATLPEKWIKEKLIDQQVDINNKMIEELIKLVESKNINNNLEMIQSAPLDSAIIPIHPKSPRLILFALLGAVGGTFIGIAWVLIGSIFTGIQATQDNLRLSGQHVSGTLSRAYSNLKSETMLDSDLNTLRRLISFLESSSSKEPNEAKSLLVVTGNGPDYTSNLAELMCKKGFKLILLQLSFDTNAEPKELPGLLQYLEGKADQPKILKRAGYDYMSAGGFSRFSNEFVGSLRFQHLMQVFSKEYDWIIAVTHAPLHSAEAESLLEKFPFAAISITDELLNELRDYLTASKDETGKRLTFLMTPKS